MPDLVVHAKVAESTATAVWGGAEFACLVGRAGPVLAAGKREGDGATPVGVWRPLYGLYRADKVAKPKGGLLWRPLQSDDGWCDGAGDALYNQWVPRGYAASHEALWREDEAYDYVVVLDHNQPPVAGLGSAVFVHVWRKGATHTAGCVAFKMPDLKEILDTLAPTDRVVVQM